MALERTSAVVKFSAIVHPPPLIGGPFFDAEFSRGLKELRGMKSLTIFESCWHDRESFAASLVQKKRDARNEISRLPSRMGHTLELTITLKYPGDSAIASEVKINNGQEIDRSALKGVWLSVVAFDTQSCIHLLILATQIAYSGAVQITPSEWSANGETEVFSSPNYFRLAQATEHLIEHSVAPTTSLAHTDVGEWLRTCNGLFSGSSNNAVSRAVNLLTHAFDGDIDTSSGKEWVWALAGIESLLNEGGHSTQGQLKEKLHAIFGSKLDQHWLRSVISDVYSSRSNLLHGKKNLPSSFLKETKEAMSHMDKEDIACFFSIGFLVLLIQELIQSKRDEYRFSFSLAPSPLPHAACGPSRRLGAEARRAVHADRTRRGGG